MRMPRPLAAAAAGTALALGAGLAVAPAAAAAEQPGTTSLAAVLTSDRNKFDANWADFDIVTEAVLAVLTDDASSPVSALTDGTVALTAFIPDDGAFRALVHDLTGTWVKSEADVFTAVASLGIDTVETVLLYHVVVGPAIDSAAALAADGVSLTTAQGGTFKVRVLNPACPRIRLIDADPNDVNPIVIRGKLDLNKGNQQIAHGINRVLRPLDI